MTNPIELEADLYLALKKIKELLEQAKTHLENQTFEDTLKNIKVLEVIEKIDEFSDDNEFTVWLGTTGFNREITKVYKFLNFVHERQTYSILNIDEQKESIKTLMREFGKAVRLMINISNIIKTTQVPETDDNIEQINNFNQFQEKLKNKLNKININFNTDEISQSHIFDKKYWDNRVNALTLFLPNFVNVLHALIELHHYFRTVWSSPEEKLPENKWNIAYLVNNIGKYRFRKFVKLLTNLNSSKNISTKIGTLIDNISNFNTNIKSLNLLNQEVPREQLEVVKSKQDNQEVINDLKKSFNVQQLFPDEFKTSLENVGLALAGNFTLNSLQHFKKVADYLNEYFHKQGEKNIDELIKNITINTKVILLFESFLTLDDFSAKYPLLTNSLVALNDIKSQTIDPVIFDISANTKRQLKKEGARQEILNSVKMAKQLYDPNNNFETYTMEAAINNFKAMYTNYRSFLDNIKNSLIIKTHEANVIQEGLNEELEKIKESLIVSIDFFNRGIFGELSFPKFSEQFNIKKANCFMDLVFNSLVFEYYIHKKKLEYYKLINNRENRKKEEEILNNFKSKIKLVDGLKKFRKLMIKYSKGLFEETFMKSFENINTIEEFNKKKVSEQYVKLLIFANKYFLQLKEILNQLKMLKG